MQLKYNQTTKLILSANISHPQSFYLQIIITCLPAYLGNICVGVCVSQKRLFHITNLETLGQDIKAS